jgi:hypothetical protein
MVSLPLAPAVLFHDGERERRAVAFTEPDPEADEHRVLFPGWQ